MFKGQRKVSNYPTTLNTPVSIHRVGKPKHVSKDEILSFLDTFITEKEAVVDTSVGNAGVAATAGSDGAPGSVASLTGLITVDTNLTSAVSQLRRIQRDFKGLPPAALTITPPPTAENSIPRESATTVVGTKKTFSDED
ncbi:DNA-directed RNA polymerase I subunit RPA14 KNAG_0A05080 [Huiozyma naganishii CBS 8797]|uniref:DNA-directed RNA polymerase I subunit RPA14 n=1 Tax=Huiozyma naganishii (strain ATCC MYA-139 / BCRC 22969 / CBS 8797 / KCTC 17520 / NBRC 10181 / NCYC 3082 / Yp74L-3) TaxID=1071383 RepID=J7R050_HUIN7|nr:hypothetical protein KNAG_0A05080 [Kazachstania naganishii CBS 8797]CCK68175.1 hypothetical protein KNAG_0A05080 [Kazachstania naganishii CBS 8797]